MTMATQAYPAHCFYIAKIYPLFYFFLKSHYFRASTTTTEVSNSSSKVKIRGRDTACFLPDVPPDITEDTTAPTWKSLFQGKLTLLI